MKQLSLTVDNLLGDSVIKTAFPNIRKLLLYLEVPQSQAAVGMGFSSLKMIMTDQRTNLDSEKLEALMCLSHRGKSFSAEEVNIIEIWQSFCSWRIFVKGI